jgi:hypothetical protein
MNVLHGYASGSMHFNVCIEGLHLIWGSHIIIGRICRLIGLTSVALSLKSLSYFGVCFCNGDPSKTTLHAVSSRRVDKNDTSSTNNQHNQRCLLTAIVVDELQQVSECLLMRDTDFTIGRPVYLIMFYCHS